MTTVAAPTPTVDLDPKSIALYIVVEGEPVPKARPRVSRTRYGRSVTYTPERTADAEKAIAWHARAELRGAEPDAISSFGVMLRFFAKSRAHSDIDNFCKLALDGLNSIVWKDDSQVLELHARLARGCREPRTEILVYRIASTEGETQ